MDDYEPPPLNRFIDRVDTYVIGRVLDEFEKELA